MDLLPNFSLSQFEGETSHHSGTVTTTPTQVPAVEDMVISDILIKNTTLMEEDLEVSFDGGANFFKVPSGDAFAWTPRGAIKSVLLKAGASSADYQILMNRTGL